ncbi:MAG: hypothetical protein IJI25_02420 [Eubacterium sp.]|nr:hypothetical protein [Eubacterium sp.]
MGIISDIFSVKEKLWQGEDKHLYDSYCEKLRSGGLVIQAFKVNQERPKCNGNCATCPARGSYDENAGFKEKLGSGFSADLLTHKGENEIYAIYVKKKEFEKAKELISFSSLQEKDL